MASSGVGSAVWVAVIASVVAVAGAFAPWHRSGRRVRTGAELVGVADEIGLLRGAGWTALRGGWAILPLLVGAAVGAAILRRRSIALALAGAAGAAATVVGAVGAGLPGAQQGPRLTLVAGLVAVAGSAFGLLRTALVRRSRRGTDLGAVPGPDHPVA